MFRLGFKDRYNIVHINNEIGRYVVGGAGTYMNEIYADRREDTGFIHMNMNGVFDDMDADGYPGKEDLIIMHRDESPKIAALDFDILIVQFYEFAYLITDELLSKKKIVYVVHSVPTPEPPPADDPFGGNHDLREKFERICDCAALIICVSKAEKDKLIKIYPKYAPKVRVVYNGMTLDKEPVPNTNYKKSRKVFGYIGRMDYRKGIFECIKAFRDIDAELRLACPNNDVRYLNKILEYIEGAGMQDRVTFYGWCMEERKESFLNSLDALMIPSLYEPFGYVALEGMQYGLPLISSNNGGLDEILEGYTYKYDPYEKGSLEKTIRKFMEASNEEVESQQGILFKNLKRFTAGNMIKNYHEIWDELIEEESKG